MGFFTATGYRTFLGRGNSSSVIPVSNSGLTEIKNLSNAGIQASSQTQEVTTYDTQNLGWNVALTTSQTYTVDCTLNIDTKDAGYKMLKELSRDSATGAMARWYRETPLVANVGTPGPVQTLIITNPSSNITGVGADLLNNPTTTSGSGAGLTHDVTVTGGSVTGYVINAHGSGYIPGDTVTIATTEIAGATVDIAFVVQTVAGSGSPEKHSGLASVNNFSESIVAGTIASVTFTMSGYGPYVFVAAQ